MPDTTNRSDEVFVDERPWGNFQQFVLNEAVTVKIITVNPGQRLSLQTHGHRDEMWQVLDVPLDLQIDDSTVAAKVTLPKLPKPPKPSKPAGPPPASNE